MLVYRSQAVKKKKKKEGKPVAFTACVRFKRFAPKRKVNCKVDHKVLFQSRTELLGLDVYE